LLNGSAGAAGIAAISAQVINGKLYALDKSGHYWVRYNAAWYDVDSTAPVEGAVATAIGFSNVVPSIPDNSPAGAFVAKVVVTMQPPSAPFTGALISSNPSFYTVAGGNVVLARALTPAIRQSDPTPHGGRGVFRKPPSPAANRRARTRAESRNSKKGSIGLSDCFHLVKMDELSATARVASSFGCDPGP